MTEELKTIDTVDLSPFKKLVMTIGELPSSFVESMTYYEVLAYLMNYLENDVVNAINTNAEALQELQSLYVQLKSYVDERFDELDIPEQVKITLDEMVENGEFDVIVAAAIPRTITQLFDSIATMKTANLGVGQIVQTKGFYSINDGGSANYIIENNGSADDIFTHELDNGLIARLVNTADFNVLQVGCKKDDDTFDNATILASLLKGGLNNTTIRFPAGTYYTTTINYAGDNIETNNIKLIGENATLKLLHSSAVADIKATYNEQFYVTYGIDELDFGTSCTVNTIKMTDGKSFFYLAVADKSLIPDSLTADMVIKGKTSGLEAYIASIDKNDPDGTDTARIYLYAARNDKSDKLAFTVSGSTLNELLIVKTHLGNDYLYLRFNDNTVPSAMAVNYQIKQGDKTARISNISITYETIHYVEVTCMPELPLFSAETTYLESGVEFQIIDYTNYTAGLMSLNKYQNCTISGITFDGNNLAVSKYESSYNRWNSLMTGASKNVTIENCKFINSIMAGIQIGGIGNTNSPVRHDFPEDVVVRNCYFYNNGRGDIEVIDGMHISISKCNGNGTLDIETNSSQILENVSIDSCNFRSLTPYSPASSINSTIVNVTNSVFISLLCQGAININLSNCSTHYLKPYECLIHANNCSFDLINGYNGNEHMYIENSSFYGLYQTNPASHYGNEDIELSNCIIDLSICDGNQKLSSKKRFALNDSILISQNGNKVIDDNKSTYDFNNVTMKLVQIKGGANSPNTNMVSKFSNCRFLEDDNTVTATHNALSNNLNGVIVQNCYLESRLALNNTQGRFINCIFNHTTKPFISAYGGAYAANIVTDDNSGISWNWIKTGAATSTLKFSHIEFNTGVSSKLGVTNGLTTPTVNNVNAGSTGYFVDDTTHALVQLYHYNDAITLRYVDYS